MGAVRPASRSSRKASNWSTGVCASSVLSKAHPRELPARRRREEVAVRGAAVPARRGAARTLEHQLARLELAVVLADCTFGGSKAGIGNEVALGPFPDVAEDASAWTGRDG